ncbi:MAG: TonB-dependent receptor plug domain-containing protein [Gemmatimonas sp.]
MADSGATGTTGLGARLNVKEALRRRPSLTLADLIAGRFAGLDVLTTGASGTGSRLRIRGQSTALLNADPLVIVDGVRLFGTKAPARASAPSRLDDINVEEIEDLEILSGPAATARFGPYASNGVILVTTRTGSVGRVQVRAYADGGVITDPNTYPDIWALWGKRTGQTVSSRCNLTLVPANTCVIDSLAHGNVMNIDSVTPLDRGYRTQAGAQVSGGTRAVQYFVAAEREDETGVYRMPERDQRFLEAERGVASLPQDQIRPSAFDRTSVRANVTVKPVASLRFDLSTAYIDGTTRLLFNEDNSSGLGFAAYGGDWQKNSGRNGYFLGGYRQPVGDLMSQGNSQDIGRFIGGISTEFKPVSWLQINASQGWDDGKQTNLFFLRKGEGPDRPMDRYGSAERLREHQEQKTSDIHVTFSNAITPRISSVATVGWQGLNTDVVRRSASGNFLPQGSSNPDDAELKGGGEQTFASGATSFYLSEQLVLDKVLSLSGTLRRDAYSYGSYDVPDGFMNGSLGASWTLSEHAFMQHASAINLLRLRAGYGVSRTMPDAFTGVAALWRFTTPQSPPPSTAPGAETNRELDVGADLSMFGNGSLLQLTYFNKSAADVVVTSGFGNPESPAYYQRGMSVSNRGLELSLHQRILDRRNLSASFALVGSTLRNRVTEVYDGVVPPYWGNRTTLRSLPGYPMFGFWQYSYTYNDANGDGIIATSELTTHDNLQYIGPSFPTKQVSVLPNVELFNHNVRINAQIDSKWGFRKFNNTLRHQCQSQSSCRGRNDRSASLAEQAAALALTAPPRATYAGMIENGAFTRLREVTVALDLPDAFARATRSAGWTLMLTGRNLGVSTDYTGIDPEASVSASDTNTDELFSTPLPRTFVVRLNVRF